MEKQYQHTVNGQAVEQDDLNVLGEAGLIDDRVFAEILRLTPYDGSTVARGILPFRHQTSGGREETVGANGASGSVLVRPFRAFIGSRTAVATDAKKNWRDVRSAIAVGSTTLGQTVALTANGTGNPRWDLIYAAVAVDANSASVTRKVKDPTTKLIAGQSVVTTLETTVTLGVVDGVAAASPAWPSAPADAAGTYYIPLAYVRVPNGFGAASTVDERDIAMAATGLAIGGVRPATSNSKAGTYLNSTRVGTWGSSGTAPKAYLPTTMVGPAETLIVAIDFDEPSHASGDIVDDSRDWRGRLTQAVFLDPNGTFTTSTANFPWSNSGAETSMVGPGGSVFFGQTCGLGSGDTVMKVAVGNDTTHATSATIYCDPTTGYLKLTKSGTVSGKWLVWIHFSPVIENYRR